MSNPLNAVVGQSGGPTSVINQSLVGVIEATKRSRHIGKLLGARHGVRGIINDQFIELNAVPDDLLARIAQTPASALGSTRDKPDSEYCRKILASFKKHNVGYFFYIGGNDSADTARIVQELASAEGHPLQVFHIPKTIDNDLRVHDHTPGYGSAAKFVACATMGDDFDNASLPGVKINVIMGRHAGFLTAASMLGRRSEADGPHLVYVPEVAFDIDQFLGDVDRVFKRLGRCLISVSEGVHDKNGTAMAALLAERLGKQVERDSHGNVQLSGSGILGDFLGDLVKSKLAIKRVRSDTFGYLQRSFPGFVSEIDATEARLVGNKAVEFSAQANIPECSIVIRRASNSPYKIEIETTSIKNVARETKSLDTSFVTGGNNIADSFKQYALPLVGKLPAVGSFSEWVK